VSGYAVILAVSAIGSWLLTFVARRVAIRAGVIEALSDRKVHTDPTPTAGGGAMFVAFLVAMAVASRMGAFHDVFQRSTEPLGVVLGATAIFGVGLLDDVREVSAPAKVAGQVFAGSVLYLFGVTMFYFQVPFAGFISLSADLEPLLTVAWVCVITNAVNLIDGLDGLAAGIVAIAAGAFFLYSHRLSESGLLPTESVGPLVAVICCGICLGFLPHNVHKAKVFMGDAGALFLGLLMAASTMVVGGHTSDTFSGQKFFFFAPVFIPFVILGVPMIDTAFAVARRTLKRARGEGTKVLEAGDKEHLHHRLMEMGHGHRRAVLILWAWTTILSVLVLYPIYFHRGNGIIPIGIAALAVLLFTVLRPRLGADPALAGGGRFSPWVSMRARSARAGEAVPAEGEELAVTVGLAGVPVAPGPLAGTSEGSAGGSEGAPPPVSD
jgi:UDP-GlcNAc:undecaprenyl-phosphate GlcNAc-1-phosphate transferase